MKKRQSKRPILLLEVLVAFFLIVVAIFPLVGPHVFIYKSQRQFIDKIGLDRVVNEIYVDVLTELHENRIYLFDILEEIANARLEIGKRVLKCITNGG